MVTGLKNSAPLAVPVANIGPRGSINWAYQLIFGVQSPVRGVTVTVAPTTPYTIMPSVTFTGGGGTGAAAVAYLKRYFIGGGGHFDVFQIGSGPADGPPMVAGGSGYTSPPAVVLTGGDGAGAVAIATLNPGVSAFTPQRFPSVIVPLGCSVVLRGGNGTAPNTGNVFIAEYPDQLTQPGRITISPDTEISYPVDNLGSIWCAGAVGDGLIATVRGAAIG